MTQLSLQWPILVLAGRSLPNPIQPTSRIRCGTAHESHGRMQQHRARDIDPEQIDITAYRDPLYSCCQALHQEVHRELQLHRREGANDGPAWASAFNCSLGGWQAQVCTRGSLPWTSAAVMAVAIVKTVRPRMRHITQERLLLARSGCRTEEPHACS